MAKQQPEIVDGKVICPVCGSDYLVHAYDASMYGSLRIDRQGKIVSCDHNMEDGGSNFRVFCTECDWTIEGSDILDIC